MSTVSIDEAQAKLPELIRHLTPGEELIITENDRPVARLIAGGPAQTPRELGTLRGTVKYIAPDFDEPLEDFKEYMQ